MGDGVDVEAPISAANVAAAGFFSGVLGCTVTFAFQHVRTLQVTGMTSQRRVWLAAREVLAAGGGRGVAPLFRGFGVALLLYSPAQTLFYGSQTLLCDRAGCHEAVAGFLAMCVGTSLWTPMDNINQRTWIARPRTSAPAVVRDIWKTSGVSGFYRGLWLTLGVWAPLAAVFFFSYEQLDALWLRAAAAREPEDRGSASGDSAPPSAARLLSCSAVAGALATLATHPMDVVRTCFQSRRIMGLQASTATTTALGTLSAVLKQGGWWGVWTRGLQARLLAVVPDFTVGNSIFERALAELSARGDGADGAAPLDRGAQLET